MNKPAQPVERSSKSPLYPLPGSPGGHRSRGDLRWKHRLGERGRAAGDRQLGLGLHTTWEGGLDRHPDFASILGNYKIVKIYDSLKIHEK